MTYNTLNKIILIGASTGGPGQIQKIVTALPKLNNSAVIIAQHMAHDFIPSFMKRLQENSLNELSIAQENQIIEKGFIYICNGQTAVKRNSSSLCFTQKDSLLNDYNPNINLLFNSFVPFAKEFEILSVILTGIGEDGVEGCQQLGLNNSVCLTESEQSAIVDGMPNRARAVVENIKVLDIADIITEIKEFCE